MLTRVTRTRETDLSAIEQQLLDIKINIDDQRPDLSRYFNRIVEAFDKFIRAVDLDTTQKIRKTLQDVGSAILTFETKYTDNYAQDRAQKTRRILQQVFVKIGLEVGLSNEAIQAYAPKEEPRTWLKRLFG